MDTAKGLIYGMDTVEVMPQPGYRSMSLPEGLLTQIEGLLEDLKQQGIDLGYKTVSEFVKDAIRHRLEELRQIYFLGEKTITG